MRMLTSVFICGAFTALLAGCSTAGGASTVTPAANPSPSPAPAGPAFRGGGNEPSWRLDIGAAEMTLLTNFGQTRLAVPTPTARVAGTATTYVARTDQEELLVTIDDRLCVDSMSGMPHPKSVTVVTGGQTLKGCGGEPVSLLLGAPWAVDEIDGKPLVAGSQATLAFAPDGRLSGQASCNRYMGEYVLSGEGLSISKVAGTKMACDAALMEQERAFLGALGGTQNFSIAADGALLLRTGDGRAIQARR